MDLMVPLPPIQLLIKRSDGFFVNAGVCETVVLQTGWLGDQVKDGF